MSLWQQSSSIEFPNGDLHWHTYTPEQIKDKARGDFAYVITIPKKAKMEHAFSFSAHPKSPALLELIKLRISQESHGRIYLGVHPICFFEIKCLCPDAINIEKTLIHDYNMRRLRTSNELLLKIHPIEHHYENLDELFM